jgi:hypothetical protein
LTKKASIPLISKSYFPLNEKGFEWVSFSQPQSDHKRERKSCRKRGKIENDEFSPSKTVFA